jgi:HD-like signal output (HDOD) protein
MVFDLQNLEHDLPVFPSIAIRLLEMLQDPDASLQQIESLIRQDPAITQRVLRVANSPYYAGHAQSRNLSDAIVRLGMRQLGNIIVIASTGQLFDERDPYIKILWDHAVATGLAASLLMKEISKSQTDDAFLGGMLHDVGQVIIYSHYPDDYTRLIDEARETRSSIANLEEETFHYFSHMSIGGLAIKKWKLSETLAETARHHHDAETQIPENLTSPTTVNIVCLASAITNNLGFGLPMCSWEELTNLPCARQFDFGPDRIEPFNARVMEAYEAHRQVLS